MGNLVTNDRTVLLKTLVRSYCHTGLGHAGKEEELKSKYFSSPLHNKSTQTEWPLYTHVLVLSFI